MPQDVRIDHLQLQTRPGVNPLALRLGVQQSLRQARLQPTHLPPQAVLVIRRLHNLPPMPARAGRAYHWRRQLQQRIDTLARRALRPGRQVIPPDAESILFIDTVELLTCYTRDMLTKKSTWYWDQLFADRFAQTVEARLSAAWLAYPQALPATLVQLRPTEVITALNELPQSHLVAIITQLHQTYALPSAEQSATGGDPAADAGEQSPNTPSETDAMVVRATQVGSRPQPLWRAWLPPEVRRALSPPAMYLLGLCHTLVKQPQLARRPEFVREATAWLEQTPAAPQTAMKRDAVPQRVGSLQRPAAAEKAVMAWTSALPAEETTPAKSEVQDAPVMSPVSAAEMGEEIFTRLGGILYLLNALSWLQLPTTTPALAALNPWERLAAVAAALLGDRFAAYQADPIWAILVELAGLEPDARWGADLPPLPAFQLPTEWLAGLSARQQATVGEQVLQPPSLEAPLQVRLAPGLAGWLAQLRPFLRFWLQHLLSVSETTLIDPFITPATVYLTRTHLDAYLPLDTIDLNIRRAGLDRNPGWVPEYGRIITLHFA